MLRPECALPLKYTSTFASFVANTSTLILALLSTRCGTTIPCRRPEGCKGFEGANR